MRPPLPGPYDPAKKYWLGGRSLNQLLDYARRTTPVAGPGLREFETPNGIVLSAVEADSSPRRQFEIYQAADGDLYVAAGRILGAVAYADSAGNTSWAMVGDGLEEDFVTPTPSSTYGVWIDCLLGAASTAWPGQYASTGGDVILETYLPSILFSTTHNATTTGALATLIGAGAKHSYIWLGSAEIDASGEATIVQDDYGPIHLPPLTYLDNLISGDSPNQLTQGTDGGLLVP